MENLIKWPAWLPYPISWVRACANLFVASAIGKSASAALIEAIRKGEIDEPGELMAVIAVLTATCLLFHFLLIVLGHYCITKLIHKQSRFLPGWLSWREGLNASVVLVVQSLGTGIFVFFLAATIAPQTEEQIRLFVGLVGAGLLTISAYLYHYDFLVRERRAIEKAAKRSQSERKKKKGKGEKHPSPTSPKTPPPPIDPIEQELNKLRADMGFNQMRRKPPENRQ